MRHAPVLAVVVAAAVPLSGARVSTAGGSLGMQPSVAPVSAPTDTILGDLFAPLKLDPSGPDGRRVRVDRPGRPGAPWRSAYRPELGVDGFASSPLGYGRLPPGRPVLRLGLKPLAPHWLDVSPAPGLTDPFLRPPRGRSADLGVDRLAASGTTDALVRATVAARPATGVLSAAGAGVLGPGPDSIPGVEFGAFVNEYADLSMRVQTRAEIGGDWTRYEPCQERFRDSCRPRLLPQLQPDLRFDVKVGGTIGDRIHVDVDFDQMREFEATNSINIFYEGAADDILRRVEVGDVTFDLPPSRFLTRALPAGNFGFQATAQLGPVDVRTVWAQQKGDLSSRVFRLSGVGNQRRFVQEDTVVWDDADYARGQFFFLVPPETLDDYPHVDVLSLDAGSAPAGVLPGVEPVQLYRFDASPQTRQQVEGYIQADAILEEGGSRVEESGWFRYLQAGEDYFIHPSGLWVALRNPLTRDEMLAMTYVTAAGDTIGDYNPEVIYAGFGRPELQLLKASGANHQPNRPTWTREMHNIYRISSGSDVDPRSVQVTVSFGEPAAGNTFVRSATGESVTYLRLFGLDAESPVDEVDLGVLYQPGRDVFQTQPPVDG